MKYMYAISDTDLRDKFSGLLTAPDQYREDDQPTVLTRDRQNYDDIVKVTICNNQDMLILLDYLSYDKSSWDYEPKIDVTIGNNTIRMNRRGNYGHKNQLDKGDYLIIDEDIAKALNSGDFLKGTKDKDSLYDQISAQNKALCAANETIEALRKELAAALKPKPVPVLQHPDNLPF